MLDTDGASGVNIAMTQIPQLISAHGQPAARTRELLAGRDPTLKREPPTPMRRAVALAVLPVPHQPRPLPRTRIESAVFTAVNGIRRIVKDHSSIGLNGKTSGWMRALSV